MAITAPAGEVSPDEIGAAVARVLASEEFGNSKRLRRFLCHIVEKTLAGELNAVKEYNIALAVFDREATFDPATDTIVRVEARRLRNRLAAYYSGAGRLDPVVIEIPKGGYTPVFRSRHDDGTDAGSAHRGPFRGRRLWLWLAGVPLLGAGAGVLLWHSRVASGFGVPNAWVLDGTTLRVLDAHNRTCWEKHFAAFDTSYSPWFPTRC